MTTIFNDGERLHLTLRGLDFVGNGFDLLEPNAGATPDQLGQFSLHLGCLCDCHIECQIPVAVQVGEEQVVGHLLNSSSEYRKCLMLRP